MSEDLLQIELNQLDIRPDIDSDTNSDSIKDTSKAKARKIQTDEQYQHQLSLWNETGPTINTETWLYENLDKLTPGKKIDKQKILHACEKAYYERDYNKCCELITKGEDIFEVDLESITEEMINNNSSASKKKRLDNDIIELYKLKNKCKELL
ncbi:unnamed protein product [Candida verbasci]|uniref:Uncharacterized protein n=1 Tax=Candida verbasci TaxID=1227364 RepID=A0A9W4XBK4_9ASCO|nr:unnamed protein product [Candida verbasci]